MRPCSRRAHANHARSSLPMACCCASPRAACAMPWRKTRSASPGLPSPVSACPSMEAAFNAGRLPAPAGCCARVCAMRRCSTACGKLASAMSVRPSVSSTWVRASGWSASSRAARCEACCITRSIRVLSRSRATPGSTLDNTELMKSPVTCARWASRAACCSDHSVAPRPATTAIAARPAAATPLR